MDTTMVRHPSFSHENPKVPLDVYRPPSYLVPALKERKTRASKPKSRSGCKTCKLRRVKCDEGKPFCQRCQKFGITCDGYENKKTKKDIKTSMIVPKRELAIRDQPLPNVHLQPDLAFHLRVEPEDTQYFRFFREESTLDLCGGFFDEPVWTRMVLQSCHEANCIQKIALSIAGYLRAMKANDFKDPIASKDPHVEYALQQNIKALTHFRLFVASNGKPDPRMLLMAGLLIFCFECLQGNLDVGIQQIKSMISAFKDMRSLKMIDYHHLPGHSNGSFEEELITEIARLDGMLIGRVDDFVPGRETVIGISHGHVHDPFVIPDRFLDIRTARRFLEHLQHLSAPNIYYHRNEEKGEMAGGKIVQGPQINMSEAIQRMVKTRLAEWWRSFKPLFDLACTPDGDNNFVAVATLRIQALSTSLVLQTNQTLDPSQATSIGADAELLTKRGPDVLFTTCRELLDWSWMVVSHRRFVKGFIFCNGIIASIWMCMLTVSGYRRDMLVEIVDLLKTMAPRREGYWKSSDMLSVAEGLLANGDERGW